MTRGADVWGAGGTGGTCPARAECTSRGYGGNPGSVRRPMTSRLIQYCAAGPENVTPPGKKFRGRRCGRSQRAEYDGLGSGCGEVAAFFGSSGAAASGSGGE